MKVSLLLQCLLVSALILPPAAFAELDQVQSRMLAPYARPLRWDNIEQAPYWVRGNTPVLNTKNQLHEIHLEAQDWVEVRVPSGEILRIHGIENPLNEETLSVLATNGSGLYLQPPLQITEDSLDWLVRAEFSAPTVYRIENTSNTARTIALFISRYEQLDELAPYRQLIALPTQEVALRRTFQAVAQPFWLVDEIQPIEVKVTGPRRLRLEHRMRYPSSESRLLQTWRVDAWLDDQKLHTAELESNVETLQEILVDQSWVVASRKEEMVLEIPEGEHLLRLQSSAPLYARLLLQDSTDYLYPELNQPRLPAEDARADLAAKDALQMSWQLSQTELKNSSDMSAVDSNEVELAAQRLGMDNRWREGGMVGAALIEKAAETHPEDAALKTRAAYFSGAHTFYRDLLPLNKDENADMAFRWFRLVRLPEFGKDARNLVVSPQHTQDLLDRLGSGHFITLPDIHDASPTTSQHGQQQRTETIRELIAFEPYSDRITAEAKASLEALAKRWQPKSHSQLEIHGYTASNRDAKSNQQLSERRAHAVASQLAALGLNATVVNAEGKGIVNPKADNNTRAGRKQNRRVEITFQQRVETTSEPAPQKLGYALYRLPEAYTSRNLRIAAYGGKEITFFVQIDQAPPRKLTLAPTERLPAESFAPSLGDGGLLLQRLEHDANNQGTLSGKFSTQQISAPMVVAGVTELTLPPHAREIRLWRTADMDADLHVAVQYQASAAFQLSEREFLSIFDLNNENGLPIRQALRNGWLDKDSPDGELLATQWRPLARLLASENRQAQVGVHPSTSPPPTKVDGQKLAQLARSAERESQWLLALEHWSRIWFSTSPETLKEEAEWGRIRALQQLGEDFMFEQMLKQILFFDPATQRRLQALRMLEKHYQTTQDEEALLRLYAVAVHQFDIPDYWQKITENLLNSGDFRLALLAGLALPAEQRPAELLLQASWRLRWWDTFEQLRSQLKNHERQAFWQGMRHASLSQFEEATQQLTAAGEVGQLFANHIETGLTLRNALAAEVPTTPATYQQWVDWQKQIPGPRSWRDTPESVKDFAGALPGYAIDRDLHFSLYQATAQHPLKLLVTGPAKIRLEVRPIHATVNGATLDGWVTAKSPQSMWTVPIIANQPTEGLQLVDGTIVGRKIAMEIPIAPGQQQLSIDAGKLPIAVRVYIEQANLSVGVLPTPPLADATDDYSEHIRFEKISPPESGIQRLAEDWICERCITVVSPEQNEAPLRFRISSADSEEESVLVVHPPVREEDIDQEARLVANKAYDKLLDNMPLGKADAVAVLKRMTRLLWIAENSPMHYERALAHGQALANANAGIDGLSRMLDRLSRNSGWNALETVQDSAGVRLLPMSGWQPESPSSRMQKALLPPLTENEQVISGNARLVLALVNTQSGSIDFDLKAEELGGLPPQPMQIAVQQDDDAVELITLMPNASWRTQSFRFGTGKHALRFYIPQPVANQLVRIRLKERKNQAVTHQYERLYHIATHKEPIKALIPGPVWLRVDEWRQGQTETRYQYLKEAWQTITLSPAADQQEALFRLHIRAPAPTQPPAKPRYIASTPVPIPHPPFTVEPLPSTGNIRLVDAFELGRQEDGTWTWGISGHSRYDADSNGKEKYLETSLTHRYFDEDKETYFTSQGLARLRQHGDPTLGVKFRADYVPWTLPYNFFAEASAYSQTIPLIGEDNWSAQLRAGISQHRDINPKTWHTPWFTAFARYLGDEDRHHPEDIDQDIYTQYKSQHRFGYEIGDRVTHRPWLDTLWSASLSLTSNEVLLTPDKIRASAEWRQRLGDWQLDAHADLTHFFDDNDRKTTINRKEFGVSLQWEHWLENLDRIEVLFDVSHRFSAGGTWGWLGLNWHFDHGRGYRDFRPGEIDFRDLRERNIPDQPNNQIEIQQP